jgi:predicted aldo/keto reductase-like oxidoreductase
MYHLGMSEKVLGMALKDGYREKVYLVTKLPMVMLKKVEDFESYLTKQLEKLQTDHLDVYLFHQLNQSEFAKMKQLNLIEKMEQAKQAGKIKHFGFSFHDTWPIFKQIVDFYPWEVVQIQYNYMDTGIQATIDGLKYAANKGMAIVVMEPLKGGQLANPPAEAMNLIKNAPVKRTPVDWALQYLWNLPEVSVVLSGMGSMQMVEENCASADKSGINLLTAPEMAVINQLVKIYRRLILVPCTGCQYCMPCPAGVNIPQNFAILNNASMGRFGNIQSRVNQWLIKRNYNKMAKTKDELKSRPNTGNATLCIKCNQCVKKCPQAIQIPTELEKVDAILGKGKKISNFYPDSE